MGGPEGFSSMGRSAMLLAGGDEVEVDKETELVTR